MKILLRKSWIHSINLVNGRFWFQICISKTVRGHSTTTRTKYYPILTPSRIDKICTLLYLIHLHFVTWPSLDFLLTTFPPRRYWMTAKLNPNWHEAGRIYPPYNNWNGFCQLNFYQNFQTFLEMKIEINRDNLTSFQAHWVL